VCKPAIPNTGGSTLNAALGAALLAWPLQRPGDWARWSAARGNCPRSASHCPPRGPGLTCTVVEGEPASVRHGPARRPRNRRGGGIHCVAVTADEEIRGPFFSSQASSAAPCSRRDDSRARLRQSGCARCRCTVERGRCRASPALSPDQRLVACSTSPPWRFVRWQRCARSLCSSTTCNGQDGTASAAAVRHSHGRPHMSHLPDVGHSPERDGAGNRGGHAARRRGRLASSSGFDSSGSPSSIRPHSWKILGGSDGGTAARGDARASRGTPFVLSEQARCLPRRGIGAVHRRVWTLARNRNASCRQQ